MLLNELLDFFLLENKQDYIATQLGDKLMAAAKSDSAAKVKDAQDLVAQLAKMDPTGGKHLQFLAKMYVAKQFKLEDTKKISDTLKNFEKFRVKLDNKDLNSYKTLAAVYDVLEPFEGKPKPMSNAELERLVKKGANKILKTPELTVVQPTTEEAAKLYGAGTKWCTAADENCMFEHYAEQGEIYVILAKLKGKDNKLEDRKFQLHYESGQFMDERDDEVGKKDIDALSDLPGYTQFLNMMIKKHYKPAIDALKGD